MVDSSAIETKLAAARTRLILEKPFLGALVLRLPLQSAEGEWCPTTATDARRFYYNPDYIDQLTLAETQFMLAHEALHCALSHFSRRQHRQKQRWDLACDLAINPILVDEGLTPPPGALVLEQYHDMTAEEIYPLLDEFDDQQSLDNHAYDSDSSSGRQPPKDDRPPRDQQPQEPKQNKDPGNEPEQERDGAQNALPQQSADSPPKALTPDEREQLQVQWQQRLAGAAQQADKAGKIGAGLLRLIEHLLQPQLPWRTLLAHHMNRLAREDFSYQRPSRREGDFIRPALRSQHTELVVALDTSGSISQQELDQFLAEVDALKAQVSARVTLLACDAQIDPECPWEFEPWELLRPPRQFDGGGGTDFRPVFEWIDRQGMTPDLLLYFTDAEGRFPDREPQHPVLWLIKGKQPVPWGQRIQLN